VAGAGEVALQQHVVVTEGSACLPLDRRQGVVKVGQLIDPAHALATAATGRLDKHRKPMARLIVQKVGVLIRAVVAGQQRHARCLHQRLGARLVTHGENGGAGGPMKRKPRCSQAVAKSLFSDRKP
jgi:hypothetical protein